MDKIIKINSTKQVYEKELFGRIKLYYILNVDMKVGGKIVHKNITASKTKYEELKNKFSKNE